MKRIALPQDYLLNLNIELILNICFLLLQDDFLGFTNFFQVFVVYKNDEEVFNLLHHLYRTNMHVYKLSWNPVISVRFTLLLQMCSEMTVFHAASYNACNNLFLNNQVNENMFFLDILADYDPCVPDL